MMMMVFTLRDVISQGGCEEMYRSHKSFFWLNTILNKSNHFCFNVTGRFHQETSFYWFVEISIVD